MPKKNVPENKGEQAMTPTLWFFAIWLLILGIVDLWLHLDKKKKGDTITEEIRNLHIRVRYLLILSFGILIGHLFWH